MFPRERPPRALEGFDILQRLGVGGAGEVFLARSRGGRLVAIKTIADANRARDGSSDALAREASVCARLKHPCIVQVRAFLEDLDFAALVFEYVPGVALARVLRICQARGLRLPDRAAWHVVERVLVALSYAHGFRDEGGQPTPIVHRDISPSNVLLDWSGGVKIADFGIAKVLGVSTGTLVGIVKGTLGCMAPEQARGEAVDERADVYAAALLAWRLATGRVPFARHQADEFELLRAMRNPRIKPLEVLRPDLPPPLLAAIGRALEPELRHRTITAAELAAVVSEQVDVGAGWLELATLLEKWKSALERSVKRAPQLSSTASTDGAIARAESTLRYEEVALAFDDEPAPDGPTIEAHALPSDPAALAALPVAGTEEEGGEVARDVEAEPSASTSGAAVPDVAAPPTDPSERPPPPVRIELEGYPDGDEGAGSPVRRAPPAGAPERAKVDRMPVWAPILLFAAFAVLAVLAALLASIAR
jgi:serine/threonine protein kinase